MLLFFVLNFYFVRISLTPSNAAKASTSGGKKRLSFSAANATANKPAGKAATAKTATKASTTAQAAAPLGRTPKSTAGQRGKNQNASNAALPNNYDFGNMDDEDLYFALPPGLNAAKGSNANHANSKAKEVAAPSSLSEETMPDYGANDYGDDFSHEVMNVEEEAAVKPKGKRGRKPKATPAKTVAKELTPKKGAKPASPKIAKPPPKDAKKAAAAEAREKKKREKEEEKAEKAREKAEKAKGKAKLERAQNEKQGKVDTKSKATTATEEQPAVAKKTSSAKAAAQKKATPQTDNADEKENGTGKFCC
jgi:hypothetical protein